MESNKEENLINKDIRELKEVMMIIMTLKEIMTLK